MRLSNSTPRCLRKLDLLKRHLAHMDFRLVLSVAVILYAVDSRTMSLKQWHQPYRKSVYGTSECLGNV